MRVLLSSSFFEIYILPKFDTQDVANDDEGILLEVDDFSPDFVNWNMLGLIVSTFFYYLAI